MSLENKQLIEGYIFALSEENCLNRLLKKCEKHGFNISTGKIRDLLNKKRKKVYI